MKQKQIIIAITTLFFLSACHFSKGVKKDLSTGLSTSYNGFSVEDIYLTVDSNKINTNKITLGKKIEIVINGVENFEEKDGKVFPGCSILLTDKTGKEILNLADAFADMNAGIDPSKAGLLAASLNTGEPMQVGQTYHLKTRFYDKQKKESEIISEIDLVMQ
jgi:hypothetical protein